ncbi:MAG: hypothetical protein IJ693_00005 [Bacteroidaceae bacterium]|nr:hypothetical protein [Bacteroidaceae bacterium]
MKKSLLFLATMLCSAVSFAQWTQPIPEFQALADDGETIQYMYNVEYGGFFLGANAWGTRASVSKTYGFKMKFEKVYAEVDDDGNPIGDPTGWALRDSVEAGNAKGKWNEYDCQGFDNLWCDGAGRSGAQMWQITALGGNKYNIYSLNVTCEFDAGTYPLLGWAPYNGGTSHTECYMLDYTKVDADEVPLFDESKACTTWAFVSEAAYAAWQGKAEIYQAALALGDYLTQAKADCPTADFSAPEAVYNNNNSQKDELEAALSSAKEIANAWKSAQASVKDPKNMTDLIENSTFDKIGDFTGWKGDSFGAGGTTSTCAEHYEKNFNTYQDVNAGEDIPNGVYKVGVTGFYRAGSAAADWSTRDDISCRYAKFYAKSGEGDSIYTDLPALASWATDQLSEGVTVGDGLYVPNTMAQFTTFKESGYGKDIYLFVPVENNKLRIGVAKTTKLGSDWTIVDDFTLTYYGDAIDAYQLWLDETLKEVEESFNAISEDTPYDKNAYKKYTDYAKEAKAATTKEDIKKYAAGISEVAADALSSIAAYAKLQAKIEELNELRGESDLEGIIEAYWDMMDAEDKASSDEAIDYLKELGCPDSLMNIVDVAPAVLVATGDAAVEGLSCSKSTEEVNAYISALQQIYTYAVANSLREGQDCTTMLTNPSFSTGDFTGWTYKEGKLGDKNVECYEQVVEISQTIKAPAGIYSISVQSFERPASNGNYDGTEESKVFLYMNDFQTPVQNIVTDALPEEQAVDGENCLLTSGTNTVPTWPCDYLGEWGYVPNSVTGARIAFEAGRYVQNVYGLVGDDGVMKIGLTSNGVQCHWVLWANFKLTYMGKNVNALKNVLPTFTESLENYIADNADNLTEPATKEAEAVLKAANTAIADSDAEGMYQALTQINSVMNDMKANVAAVTALQNAADALETAFNDYGEEASEEAQNAYAAVKEKVDAYTSLTTAEVEALTDEVNNAATALKIPAYADASDDNPVDMSRVIVNATFDTIGDFTGWEGSSFGAGGTTSTCAERYNMNYDTYQDLKGLPAGTYRVSVKGFYRQGSAENDYNNTVADGGTPAYNAYLYSIGENGDSCLAVMQAISTGRLPEAETLGGSTVTIGQNEVVPNSMESANYWFTADYYAPNDDFNSLIVKVGEDGKLRIGVRKDVTISGDWSIFDDFKLEYFGTNSSKKPSVSTEIESVEVVAPVKANGKYFENGKIVIIKNGVKYNVAGQVIK